MATTGWSWSSWRSGSRRSRGSACRGSWNRSARRPSNIRTRRRDPLSARETGGNAMELDEDKIDDAVLALLYLGLHSGVRAWKGFDWDAMKRLYEKDMIGDPVTKPKSVVFTEAGLSRKTVVEGKSVSDREALGGSRI